MCLRRCSSLCSSSSSGGSGGGGSLKQVLQNQAAAVIAVPEGGREGSAGSPAVGGGARVTLNAESSVGDSSGLAAESSLDSLMASIVPLNRAASTSAGSQSKQVGEICRLMAG